MDGEQVISVTPDIGFLHRNFEKICANRTYPQVMPYTDRLDYCAAFAENLSYLGAVEKLLGSRSARTVFFLLAHRADTQEGLVLAGASWEIKLGKKTKRCSDVHIL